MLKNIYTKRFFWKILFLILGLIIALSSLYYSNNIVQKLADEEEKKVKLIAKAWRELADVNSTADISFLLDIIKDNSTVPVILATVNNEIVSWKNLDSLQVQQNPSYLQEVLQDMKNQNEAIPVVADEATLQYIYYKNSILIDALKFYPWIQLSVIFLFMILAYSAFSSSRNAEQKQVWVGMAKETAHQLGTPLSSLYGWLEYFKSVGTSEEICNEIAKDIERLNIVADRFSKIGSVPKLEKENLVKLMQQNIDYLQKRISKNIKLTFISVVGSDSFVFVSVPLFNWVIENVCKNAVDAMGGNGELNIEISEDKNGFFVDIQDTGKGIPKAQIKQIFKPGITSKKRGWGLGLSLAKRIIKEYHQGKIFVKHSEVGVGTTIRIVLPKQINS
jgi:signal transduction histidine kinase